MRIPFDMCDPVGILFYGSVYHLAHRALEEALPKIGISWNRWFHSESGAPVRYVECDYLKPIKANEIYDIEVRFTQITTSSVNVNYQFKREDEVHCELDVTKVFVDRKVFKKTSMPDDLKQIFLKHSQ